MTDPEKLLCELIARLSVNPAFLPARDPRACDTKGSVAAMLTALCQLAFRLAGQKNAAGADYFCDAAVLARAGIASVVFGPGDIAQVHTAEEWIGRKSLEAATALPAKFLRSLP